MLEFKNGYADITLYLPSGEVRMVTPVPDEQTADRIAAAYECQWVAGRPPDDASIVQDGAFVPKPVPQATLQQLKADLTQSATAWRWQVETGGIALPDGAKVLTSTADQNRISNAVTSIASLSVPTVDFKTADGTWVTMTAEQLRYIAAAVGQHVQACFSAERAHHELIAALDTVAEAAAYDVTTGWPSNS